MVVITHTSDAIRLYAEDPETLERLVNFATMKVDWLILKEIKDSSDPKKEERYKRAIDYLIANGVLKEEPSGCYAIMSGTNRLNPVINSHSAHFVYFTSAEDAKGYSDQIYGNSVKTHLVSGNEIPLQVKRL